MNSNLSIYFTDLNNTLPAKPYPLNIAYIASYLMQQQKNVDIKLYKDPDLLCNDIQSHTPSILAMSNSCWNTQLNFAIMDWVNKTKKKPFIILGGHNLTYNDPKCIEKFFLNYPYVDAYIFYHSEEMMTYLTAKMVEYNFDLSRFVKNEELPYGLIINVNNRIYRGTMDTMFEVKKNLDYIPSPYLNGLLDEFLNHEDLFPIFETTRGCPYSCTFCCWGTRTKQKLQSYSMERIIDELNYIKNANPKNKFLYCADGNFGILKRDITIAEHLRNMWDTSGFPEPIYLYVAKNNTENIVQIAKILSPIMTLNLARQTENADVLKNIKRANISEEAFNRVRTVTNQENISNQIEIIYPLPGETLQTFYSGLARIMEDVDPALAELRLYALLLLQGSEMSEPQYREKYGFKTAFRKTINSGFQFKDQSNNHFHSSELDEIVVSTNTFSLDDFYNVRVFHLFLCLFQTYKVYAYILKYILEKTGTNPITFLKELVINIMNISKEKYPSLRNMLDDFLFDIKDELHFADENTKERFVSEALKDKEYKLINIHYLLALLYSDDNRTEFYEFLKNDFLSNYMSFDAALNLVNYVDAHIVDFNQYQPKTTKTVTNPLSGETETFDLQVAPIVANCWAKLSPDSKNLIETLQKVYQLSYPGHLDKVILYVKENTQTEVKELVYTLH